MTNEETNANGSNPTQELKAQEAQLRSRYGNIDKRKGNAMLMKKLQGNNKKFFDSGDYNMQKAKTSLGPNPLAKKPAVPIQKPAELPLPPAVRRESAAEISKEISPEKLAALQGRRGSQSALANVSH